MGRRKEGTRRGGKEKVRGEGESEGKKGPTEKRERGVRTRGCSLRIFSL